MLKVYTDASFKNGVSSHHYYVYRGKRRIKRRTFLNECNQTPFQAEAMTIIEALKFHYKNGIDNLIIHTDCKSIVKLVGLELKKDELKKKGMITVESKDKPSDTDINYIKHLLKSTNSKLVWMPREHIRIHIADTECRKMMSTKMNRVNRMN